MQKVIGSIVLVGSFLAITAQAQIEILIPPQYECTAVDASGENYLGTSHDEESTDVRTFSGTANEQSIVQTGESAMKKCLQHSDMPKSCDLKSCHENPQ